MILSANTVGNGLHKQPNFFQILNFPGIRVISPTGHQLMVLQIDYPSILRYGYVRLQEAVVNRISYLNKIFILSLLFFCPKLLYQLLDIIVSESSFPFPFAVIITEAYFQSSSYVGMFQVLL